jgi:hypothetical protein
VDVSASNPPPPQIDGHPILEGHPLYKAMSEQKFICPIRKPCPSNMSVISEIRTQSTYITPRTEKKEPSIFLDVQVCFAMQRRTSINMKREKNSGRSKIKLTAAQSRVLCTRLVASAWSRTLKSIDPLASFLELGYVWKDDSLVRPPSVPGYCFDPTTVDYFTNNDPNMADDQRIDEEARKAANEHAQNLHKGAKQLSLLDFWKTV